MESFLLFVMLVSGILNVILFFKLWGMTNNVKEMKEKYVDITTTGSFTHHYYLTKHFKGRDEATLFLKDAIMNDVKSMLAISNTIEKAAHRRNLEMIKQRYSDFLLDSGYEMPIEDILLDIYGPDELGEFKIGMTVEPKEGERFMKTRVIRVLIPATNEAIDQNNNRFDLNDYRPA